MSDSIGGIGKFGMNFTPISSYNKLLSNSLGEMNIDSASNSLNEFQNILNDQMSNVQDQDTQVNSIHSGISMDVNRAAFDLNQHVGESSNVSPVAKSANNLSSALGNGLNSLNEKQLAAQTAVETLASGGDISVHDVMIASQKSSLNMQMALQLRNKILTAYNELYQMRF